jgi:hypothetical protein
MEWYLHSVKGLVSSLVLRLNLSGLSKLTLAAARLEECLAPRPLGWVHRHRERPDYPAPCDLPRSSCSIRCCSSEYDSHRHHSSHLPGHRDRRKSSTLASWVSSHENRRVQPRSRCPPDQDKAPPLWPPSTWPWPKRSSGYGCYHSQRPRRAEKASSNRRHHEDTLQ